MIKLFQVIFMTSLISATCLADPVKHKFPNRIMYRKVAKKSFNDYNKWYPGMNSVYVRPYPDPYKSYRRSLYRPYLGGRSGGVIYWSPNYNVIFR